MSDDDRDSDPGNQENPEEQDVDVEEEGEEVEIVEEPGETTTQPMAKLLEDGPPSSKYSFGDLWRNSTLFKIISLSLAVGCLVFFVILLILISGISERESTSSDQTSQIEDLEKLQDACSSKRDIYHTHNDNINI